MFRLFVRVIAFVGLPAVAMLVLDPPDHVSGFAEFLVNAAASLSRYCYDSIDWANKAAGFNITSAVQPLILFNALLSLVLADAFAEFGVHSYWFHVVNKRPWYEVLLRVPLLWGACILLFGLLFQATAQAAGLELPAWLTAINGVVGDASSVIDWIILAWSAAIIGAILFWHPGIGWRVLVLYAFLLVLAYAPDAKPFFDWLNGHLPTAPPSATT